MSQDRTYAEGELPLLRRFKWVSPGFLGTLGTRLVAGRDITWSDLYQKVPVAIISENFAREYWHDATSALGKRIRAGNTDVWREVIGVAGDVYDDGVNQAAPTAVYWPVMMNQFDGQKDLVRRDIAFAIRSPRAGSETFMKEVRQTVWSADPSLPVADVHTLGYFYTQSMARTSFTLIMLAVAGGMALGAQRPTLTAMFVRQGLWLTGIGVVCGLVAAFATMRLMSSLLFNVSPVDPVSYTAMTFAVLATAYLACYLPSRRAATVDPLDALRAD
jgi:hypothetical protein